MTVFPWDIALAPPGTIDPGSARNHLEVAVVSVTAVGNRVRVGLAAPQPLTAELTEPAVERLAHRAGSAAHRVVEGHGDASCCRSNRVLTHILDRDGA